MSHFDSGMSYKTPKRYRDTDLYTKSPKFTNDIVKTPIHYQDFENHNSHKNFPKTSSKNFIDLQSSHNHKFSTQKSQNFDKLHCEISSKCKELNFSKQIRNFRTNNLDQQNRILIEPGFSEKMLNFHKHYTQNHHSPYK